VQHCLAKLGVALNSQAKCGFIDQEIEPLQLQQALFLGKKIKTFMKQLPLQFTVI